MSAQRLDAALAERGIFPSRTAAAASIRAGEVQVGVDGPFALKPSHLVEADTKLIVTERARYASRGGIKLQNALDELGIDVAGRDCIDVGASTGGFTDCLLQGGAARVIALDVSYGQLDQRLAEDPRVTVLDRTNGREISPRDLPFEPHLAIVDVSFISLIKVLPAVVSCLPDDSELLAMVKPQFEVGRHRSKGGIVRSAADRREAIVSVARCAEEIGLTIRGMAYSGLPGPKGNRETFVWGARSGPGVDDLETAALRVEP